MDIINSIGILLGASWASGINLYLSAAGLGIAQRMDWVDLPGNMEILANPIIIGVSIIFFVIEFVADKIPFVDSAWDSVHTFIRPLAGSLLGYAAGTEMGPVIQVIMTLFAGTVALDSHLTKATTRLAINTIPEPVTNSVASVAEDATVIGVLYLMMHNPMVIMILVPLFVLFSIWFLIKMFRFVKKVFKFKGAEKHGNAVAGM